MALPCEQHRTTPSQWKWPALFLLGLCPALQAQELSLEAGVTTNRKLENLSYAWQIDYQQEITRNFAASFARINEGHVPGHHRDGNAWMVWGRLPMAEDKFILSIGLGLYNYYDTQALSSGDSADVHGNAAIYSVSATGYFANRLFYKVTLNHMKPTHDIAGNTATMGLGFWFGQDRKPTPGELGHSPEEHGYITENEFTLFAGQSIVNTLFSQQARAYAVEYRRGFASHIDGTLSLIYEGDPEIVRRSGVALQAWGTNTFFAERLSLGVGIGPYIYIDRKHPNSGNSQNPSAIAPLISLTFSGRITESWVTRLTWHRVASSYNRDSDIILLGLGYRWALKHP